MHLPTDLSLEEKCLTSETCTFLHLRGDAHTCVVDQPCIGEGNPQMRSHSANRTAARALTSRSLEAGTIDGYL